MCARNDDKGEDSDATASYNEGKRSDNEASSDDDSERSAQSEHKPAAHSAPATRDEPPEVRVQPTPTPS